MHPRIAEMLEYIETERAKLRDAAERVPEKHRNEEPGPGRWSVAQVLEHVSMVETRVAGVFRMRFEEARAAGVGADPETSPILPTLDLSGVTDRTQRINAPPATHPTATLTADQAMVALENSRRGFRETLLSGDGLALSKMYQAHPVFGELNLYNWLGLMGSHDARHAEQIEEIAATLSARSA